MKLRLAVMHGQNPPSDGPDAFLFSESGGTVGRSVRNDWVLPDPTREISGTHAEIRVSEGQFVVIDLSTNGVFINNADAGLGKGNSAPLRNGDRLRIGKFEIIAELIDGDDLTDPAPEQQPWPFQDQSDVPAPVLPDSLFAAWGEIQPDQNAGIDGNIGDLGAFRAEGWKDDADSPPSRSTLPWDLTGFAEVPQSPEVTQPRERLQSPERPQPRELPQSLERPQPPTVRQSPEVTQPRTVPESLDVPQSPAVRQPPIDRPDARGRLPSAPDLASRTPFISATGVSSPSAGAPPLAYPLDDKRPDHANVGTPERRPAGQHSQQPPARATVAPVAETPVAETPVAETPVAETPVAETSVAETHNLPTTGERGAAAADQLSAVAALEHLLAGAGVQGLMIPTGATPATFQAIGELLALFAGGSAELLSTISEIKNTFRIDQTQIRQTDNNPLRWSVSPREAVKRLLTPEDDGYLPPRDAVSDAIASIKAHQIGTIRGMESALKQFLREQAPEELEQNFDRQDRPAPWANKSAWNWKQYVDYHSRLSATAQENALELLGGAFSAAYEQQVRIIRGRDRH